MFFQYGFGHCVARKRLGVLETRLRSDGLVTEVSVWQWRFEDGITRTCTVIQSYRRCKSGGVTLRGLDGRWSWTGERYSEPRNDPVVFLRRDCGSCGEDA